MGRVEKAPHHPCPYPGTSALHSTLQQIIRILFFLSVFPRGAELGPNCPFTRHCPHLRALDASPGHQPPPPPCCLLLSDLLVSKKGDGVGLSEGALEASPPRLQPQWWFKVSDRKGHQMPRCEPGCFQWPLPGAPMGRGGGWGTGVKVGQCFCLHCGSTESC